MRNKRTVDRAIVAGRRCYRMALNYRELHKVKAILYRAAAATMDSFTVVEIMRNFYEPDDEAYIDDGFLESIRRLADERKLQALHYRTVKQDDLPDECLRMVVDAFEAAIEVYASIDDFLDGVDLDNMGSILDTDLPTACAIIAAFDAHNSGEDAFLEKDYYPAMLDYRALYVAYDIAYLDIESYSPDATETNPLLKDIDGIETITKLFREWEKNTAKMINRAETEAGAVAIEQAAEALRRAADAADHAVVNLRAARLLDECNGSVSVWDESWCGHWCGHMKNDCLYYNERGGVKTFENQESMPISGRIQ